MIKYKCEECGSSLSIKDELAGTKGKCPKCKTPFLVPEAGGGPDAPPAKKSKKKAAPEKAEAMTEEDMIFGKDFFNMDESAPTPQRPPVATFEPPPEPPPKKKKKKEPFGAANPDGDNSAQVASQLLSKTGKKNKPSDFDDYEEEGEGGYDFSAINYLILWRVLPTVLGLGILIPGFYILFGPMTFPGVELPPLVELKGVVTLDGQPLANATIQFIPELDRDNPLAGL